MNQIHNLPKIAYYQFCLALTPFLQWQPKVTKLLLVENKIDRVATKLKFIHHDCALSFYGI